MSSTVDVDPHLTSLPPHGPADMLNLFMTKYDYDYNRDPDNIDDGTAKATASALDAWISGDVRNRPIFAHGVSGDRDDRTIYQVDYVLRRRGLGPMADLARIALRPRGDTKAETSYEREWYRPDFTKHVTAGGAHPITVYQADYCGEKAAPVGAVGGKTPPIYAGAAAVAYNADLLKPFGVVEDDGADIAPKITAKESLLPRNPLQAVPPLASCLEAAALAQKNLYPPPLWPRVGGDYTCTSWDYGDVSQAHPLQLPQGLDGSAAADDIDILGTVDKAALLRQLAGQGTKKRKSGSSGGFSRHEDNDRTNPIFLSKASQEVCAISHRLPEEGHVHMSIYNSDFTNHAFLPELPGNHGGSADVRNTNTNSAGKAGEMVAGSLTSRTRLLGSLRNSHGTLKKKMPEGCTVVNADMFTTMRSMEKHISIDRADKHRHKLRH